MSDGPAPVPFVPLSRGMIDGSLWESDLRVRVLFVTMLFISFEPARRGTVDITLRKLAGRAGMSPKDVRYALDVLMAPDPDSRSKGDDGRRVERLDEKREWGWRIVNWQGYEEARERMLNAARQARFKAKKKGESNAPVTAGNGQVTHGNLEGEVEVEVEDEVEVEGEKSRGAIAPPSPPARAQRFEEFWSPYPRKDGKGKAAAVWAKLSATDRLSALSAVRDFAEAWKGAPEDRLRFIPLPATWLGQARWQDDPAGWKRQAGKTGPAPRNGTALVGAHTNPKPVRDLETAPADVQDIARRIAHREDTTEAEDDRYAEWLNGGAA